MSAMERLRELLDERGVEHVDDEDVTRFFGPDGFEVVVQEDIDGKLDCLTPLYLTPEQAVTATLGPTYKPDPVWEEWHKSLRHERVETVGDAVEQLMYEAIEFGGDMGPNGNTYNGIDEGDVLTAGFINEWVERFESTLGPGTCKLTRASWDDGTCTWGCICSACDAHLEYETGIGYNYCPICGAKVVDE